MNPLFLINLLILCNSNHCFLISSVSFIEAIMQDIISYVHRKVNGVYLQDEWNWYPFSKICNNNVLIEHYYGIQNKERLKQIYENNIAY